MKEKWIRATAVLLLLVTVTGILPVFGGAQPAYSTASNSGERDVLCTTLDGTGAEDYYGNEYSYDRLSELSADDLYDSLAQLMTDTHSRITTYANCRDYATITDCENGDGRVMLIYTSYSATRGEYINDTSGGWNREHVWPKSLGGFNDSKAGADLHHIRPSDSTVNSIRNNRLYGNITGGTAAQGTAVTEYTIGGYYLGDYFEPLDNVKGDVARICLYVYVRWAEEFPQCGDITNVFQNVDVLLEWCAEDPVDTWEMGRNEAVGEIQGNRNVFIDYPEYAWLLFGRELPDDMTTPSGEASEGEKETPSCTHTNTEVKNASAATCGKSGFTGDTYCKDCGEKLRAGSTVPATGNHSFGEWKTEANGSKSRTCAVCKKVETVAAGCKHAKTETRGAVAATCKTEGYSGDIHCADCGKLIVAGNTIPVTDDHTFGEWRIEGGKLSRTCAVCETVETKDCPHENTEIREAADATCKTAGFTGDTYCKDCGTKTQSGSTIPATDDHSFGEWSTNEDGGKSRICAVCGKVETEEAAPDTTPPVDCSHINVEYRDAVEASCKEGYSGDVYCKDCGEFLEKGMVHPAMAPHVYGDPDSADGTQVCKVCGHKITADDTSGFPAWVIVAISAALLIALTAAILIKKRKA